MSNGRELEACERIDRHRVRRNTTNITEDDGRAAGLEQAAHAIAETGEVRRCDGAADGEADRALGTPRRGPSGGAAQTQTTSWWSRMAISSMRSGCHTCVSPGFVVPSSAKTAARAVSHRTASIGQLADPEQERARAHVKTDEARKSLASATSGRRGSTGRRSSRSCSTRPIDSGPSTRRGCHRQVSWGSCPVEHVRHDG